MENYQKLETLFSEKIDSLNKKILLGYEIKKEIEEQLEQLEEELSKVEKMKLLARDADEAKHTFSNAVQQLNDELEDLCQVKPAIDPIKEVARGRGRPRKNAPKFSV